MYEPKINGSFVISLDFELYWGVRDQQSLEAYGSNILGVRKVVPILLEEFRKYGIRATWATVGFLFFRNKQELLANIPEIKPDYKDQNLSPYPGIDKIGDSEQDDPYHFGKTLLDLVQLEPSQEIATHTFCHYYCLEEGQASVAFEYDLSAAIKIAQLSGIKLQSIVFPRNQLNLEYLKICGSHGITSYRGNENAWMYKESKGDEQSLFKRAFRLLDAYINLSGHHCYSYDYIASTFPFNIPASRFLRPYSKRFKFLDGLRLRRILSSMTKAAKEGTVFHLWWHPHNFGSNLSENIIFLEKILKHYFFLQEKYGMMSNSMKDISDLLLNEQWKK